MVHFINVRHVYDRRTQISFPDLSVRKREHQIILGMSGSGKTTMLHILAGLLRPTEGEILINGTDIYKKKESDRDRFRGRNIGIIFQQIHLIPALTVMENVMLARYMAGLSQDKKYISNLLADLDIADKADSYPSELSYGQSQRVGITRAVVNNPRLILADEPTSNLDDQRSEQVLQLLEKQAAVHKSALIIATHDQRVIDQFTEYISLDDVQTDNTNHLTVI